MFFKDFCTEYARNVVYDDFLYSKTAAETTSVSAAVFINPHSATIDEGLQALLPL